MSPMSPAATSPIRSREGNAVDPYYSWQNGNEYDPALSPYGRGPPPPHHLGAPPPGHFRAPHDFWPPEPHGNAYWGPLPPYEGSSYPERRMPPPPRGPRGSLPVHQQRPTGAKYDEQEHQASLRRAPSSPGGSYSRGSHQMKREFRQPHTPRRVPASSTNKKKDGDALSILANVSADMDGNDGQRAPPQQHSRHVPMPAPTSPLQRRARSSPITPSQTPQDRHRSSRNQVTPIYANRLQEQRSAWEQQPESGYAEYPPMAYHTPRRRGYLSHYGEYGAPGYHEGAPPVLVEHGGSFDSQGDPPPYREFPYPPTPHPPTPHPPTPPAAHYYYEDHPPSFGGYWESGPHSQQGPYLPPRWNYGRPPESYGPEYPYEGHDEAFAPHRPPPPPHHSAPYTYVQQPRLEEKTILRKKFSWKHYPEVSWYCLFKLVPQFFGALSLPLTRLSSA
jgi:hypothetical protein